MRSVTIEDIAREAAVGKATVSRVINNSGYVSEKTRERITQVMERMNYHPSSVARSLSRQKSDIIGLILPEVNNQFFGDILKGVSDMAEQWGYTLMLSSSENDRKRDLRALRAMIGQRIRGLVYIPASDYREEPWRGQLARLLEQLACPVVILDRPLESFSFDTVMTDNFAGSYMATEALIRAGHRRIGIVAGNLALFIGRERLEGCRAALKQNMLKLQAQDVVEGMFDEQTTYQKMLDIFREGDFPTGYVLSNNLSAFGFLRAAEEAGLSVPQDVAFICFDKLQGQDLYGLPYSHLDRHMMEQGFEAMQMLYRRFTSPDRRAEQVVNLPELVLRGSEKLAGR